MGIDFLRKILVVDDEELGQAAMEALLSTCGFSTETTGNSHDAVRIANELNPDLVIIDWYLEGKTNGLQVLFSVRTTLGNIAAIIMSGSSSSTIKTQVAAVPNCEYLEKPFQLVDFLAAVDRLDV